MANKDIAIRGLPNHILSSVDDLIRATRSFSEVARFIHAQGYLEDMQQRALEKALERYKANNPARLLPSPVLVIADEDESLERLQEVLPQKAPQTYIDEMFEGIDEDVNELAIMIKLVQKHFARVKKAWEMDDQMPVPMESTSKEQDRLWRYLKDLMEVKQRLGVLPRVPSQIEMRSKSLNLKVDVGGGEMARQILDHLLAKNVTGEEETFKETKTRLRSGLVDG